MNRATISLAIFVGLTFQVAACGAEKRQGADADDALEKFSSPSAQSLLAAEVLRKVEMAALLGDLDATDQVVEHYLAKSMQPTGEQEYWLTIAAENGRLGYAVTLARLLREKGDIRSCYRAQFWLKRVAAFEPETVSGQRVRSQAIRDLQHSDCTESTKVL